MWLQYVPIDYTKNSGSEFGPLQPFELPIMIVTTESIVSDNVKLLPTTTTKSVSILYVYNPSDRINRVNQRRRRSKKSYVANKDQKEKPKTLRSSWHDNKSRKE